MKRLFSCILALCLALCMLPQTGVLAAEIASGVAGENVTWVIDSDGTMTYSGTGDITDGAGGMLPSWYSYKDSISHIVIEDGITGIGECAFYACDNALSITIPESVTYIGSSAFEFCTSLEEVVMGDHVTFIGDSAFWECHKLERINLSKALTEISSNAFFSCYALTEIIIPEGVTSIGRGTFAFCTGLERVQLPDTLTAIETNTFNHCTSLSEIRIPEGVTKIGTSAFESCESLNNVTLPKSLEQLDMGAFVLCDGIQEVHYAGTEAEWNNVSVGTDNDSILNAEFVFGSTGEPTNPFTDVKADRFEDAILWAYNNEITTGTGDGTTFSPESPCTRKQIVTFLWRAAGEPAPKSMENPFTDVKDDRFLEAILWAYHAGITSGTGDGTTFSPEEACTRKQVVTFLWRFNGQPAPKNTENKFTDVKTDRFTNAILWAAEENITTGTGDGTTFSPEVPCTRKQIVTFLYRDLYQ